MTRSPGRAGRPGSTTGPATWTRSWLHRCGPRGGSTTAGTPARGTTSVWWSASSTASSRKLGARERRGAPLPWWPDRRHGDRHHHRRDRPHGRPSGAPCRRLEVGGAPDGHGGWAAAHGQCGGGVVVSPGQAGGPGAVVAHRGAPGADRAAPMLGVPAVSDPLVAFLRSCLDKDEQVAREVDPDGRWSDYGPVVTAEDQDGLDSNLWPDHNDVGISVARVLAEVESKRQIIAAHDRPHHCTYLVGQGECSVVDGEPWVYYEDEHTETTGDVCMTLRLMTIPYVDSRIRPGFCYLPSITLMNVLRMERRRRRSARAPVRDLGVVLISSCNRR